MPGFEVIGQEEQLEINKVFENGGILFRHGFDDLRSGCFKVREFESNFSKFLKTRNSLAVTSGTAALRVALAALGIGLGDEVITQSFTFVATVEAIVESGATPKCANINETLNIDPNKIEELITKKTKAIIIVHMLGVPCQIDLVKEICKKYNLFLIEDTAWGCGGSLDNKFLGTWGDIGTFSFDFAKTITTGEGGMITIQNKEIFNKAVAWHDHGHENNPNLARWEDSRSGTGFNYRMMEIQGALGIAQLRKLPQIVKMQRNNSHKIWNYISDLGCVQKRPEPEKSYSTSDALVLITERKEHASKIRKSLLSNGISTKILPEAITWHFAGLWEHIPSLQNAHKYKIRDYLKFSEEILSRSVSLPISVRQSEHFPEKVRKAIVDIM